MKDSKNGILAFECSQDRYEPNVLHFWERYDGNRSMGTHNTTAEYSEFMRSVSAGKCSQSCSLVQIAFIIWLCHRFSSILKAPLEWLSMSGKMARLEWRVSMEVCL